MLGPENFTTSPWVRNLLIAYLSIIPAVVMDPMRGWSGCISQRDILQDLLNAVFASCEAVYHGDLKSNMAHVHHDPRHALCDPDAGMGSMEQMPRHGPVFPCLSCV